jgi:hypothetical protein
MRGFSRIFLLGILILKGLTARRLCKSFGVKRLKKAWQNGLFYNVRHQIMCFLYRNVYFIKHNYGTQFSFLWTVPYKTKLNKRLPFTATEMLNSFKTTCQSSNNSVTEGCINGVAEFFCEFQHILWLVLYFILTLVTWCKHDVTRHNTPIHNILSTTPRLSISQKALGTLPEDGNVMPKHVEDTIHN